MRREDHEHQADAFLGWHRKRGGALDNDFAVWAASKDLELRDYMAIKTIVVELVTSFGAVPTELSWPA